jgi:predicted transcriptional regulator
MREKRQSGLADVLFGQSRGGVLALLFGNSEKSFYTREIANMIGASVGAVAPQLTALASVGLLVASKSGNQVYYQANRKSPIFEEMKGLVAKTVGIHQQLQSAFEPLSSRIVVAFIDELLEHLAKVEKQIGRPINPTIYSVPEFSTKLSSGSHFVSSVVRGEKIFIIGGEDELRTMGPDQSSQS